MLKKLPLLSFNENIVLLYQDEFHFRDIQTVHVTWLAKEKQKKIAVLGKRISMFLFGTIDAITGEFLCTKAGCYNNWNVSEIFNICVKKI